MSRSLSVDIFQCDLEILCDYLVPYNHSTSFSNESENIEINATDPSSRHTNNRHLASAQWKEKMVCLDCLWNYPIFRLVWLVWGWGAIFSLKGSHSPSSFQQHHRDNKTHFSLNWSLISSWNLKWGCNELEPAAVIISHMQREVFRHSSRACRHLCGRSVLCTQKESPPHSAQHSTQYWAPSPVLSPLSQNRGWQNSI